MGPGGVATLVTDSLAVGVHALSASYSGDERFAGSTSLGLSQAVNRDGATVALSSSSNPSVFGARVTFTAAVTSASGDVSTGSVTFRDGFTILVAAVFDASGKAIFETAALPGGSHTISVTYDGDSRHAVSSIATVTQAVTPAPASVALESSRNPRTKPASSRTAPLLPKDGKNPRLSPAATAIVAPRGTVSGAQDWSPWDSAPDRRFGVRASCMPVLLTPFLHVSARPA